jgi:hypothetical protein
MNIWSPKKRQEKLNNMPTNPVTRKLVEKPVVNAYMPEGGTYAPPAAIPGCCARADDQ